MDWTAIDHFMTQTALGQGLKDLIVGSILIILGNILGRKYKNSNVLKPLHKVGRESLVQKMVRSTEYLNFVKFSVNIGLFISIAGLLVYSINVTSYESFDQVNKLIADIQSYIMLVIIIYLFLTISTIYKAYIVRLKSRG